MSHFCDVAPNLANSLVDNKSLRAQVAESESGCSDAQIRIEELQGHTREFQDESGDDSNVDGLQG